VVAWLLDERAKAAKVQAEREAELEETAAKIREDAAARERNLQAAKAARPWAFE
jgi:hypothetical protein